MSRRANVLTGLRITKVDRVAAGADPDARVVLFKSRDVSKRLNGELTYDERRELLYDAVREKVPSTGGAGNRYSYVRDFSDTQVVYEVDDTNGCATFLAPYSLDPATAQVTLGEGTEVTIEHNYKPVAKSATRPDALTKTVKTKEKIVAEPATIDLDALDEHVRKHVEELTKERDDAAQARDDAAAAKADLEAKVDALTKNTDPDPEPDAIDKADLPEPVRKQLEKLEKQAEEDRKAAQDAAERVAKMETEQRRASLITKAASEYGHVAKADEVADLILKAQDALDDDDVQTLERLLKSANAKIAEGGVYREFGTVGGDADDSAEKFDKAVQERIEKTGESKFEAMSAVMAANPDLASDLK